VVFPRRQAATQQDESIERDSPRYRSSRTASSPGGVARLRAQNVRRQLHLQVPSSCRRAVWTARGRKHTGSSRQRRRDIAINAAAIRRATHCRGD